MSAKKTLLEKQKKPGRDIQHILELWGAWAANDNSHIDWQPVAAGFKRLLPHTKKSRPQCNDDEGIMVDGCVARLKMYKPEEYELVVLRYVCGVSLRMIAKRRKCSDGTVRKEMQTAHGFICGCLAVIFMA
ncbi:phage antitermination protein [Yersinia enterocolitica]|uniref:antiterminator Q family protein n=1 Tax=Yersinia enterocolitica TaxID=630 RepID=UPI0005E89105|nr:antiterminator Q family protein [Yersinia enterocolitica]CNH66515.1 phage antitermination protein [Yersinia enterocolitica]